MSGEFKVTPDAEVYVETTNALRAARFFSEVLGIDVDDRERHPIWIDSFVDPVGTKQGRKVYACRL